MLQDKKQWLRVWRAGAFTARLADPYKARGGWP